MGTVVRWQTGLRKKNTDSSANFASFSHPPSPQLRCIVAVQHEKNTVVRLQSIPVSLSSLHNYNFVDVRTSELTLSMSKSLISRSLYRRDDFFTLHAGAADTLMTIAASKLTFRRLCRRSPEVSTETKVAVENDAFTLHAGAAGTFMTKVALNLTFSMSMTTTPKSRVRKQIKTI